MGFSPWENHGRIGLTGDFLMIFPRFSQSIETWIPMFLYCWLHSGFLRSDQKTQGFHLLFPEPVLHDHMEAPFIHHIYIANMYIYMCILYIYIYYIIYICIYYIYRDTPLDTQISPSPVIAQAVHLNVTLLICPRQYFGGLPWG